MSNRKQASYSKPKETQQQPSEVCISFSGCIPRPHVSRYYLAKQRHASAQGKKIQAYVLRLSFILPRGEKSTSTYVNCAIQELLPTAAPWQDKFCFPRLNALLPSWIPLLPPRGKKAKFLPLIWNYPSSYQQRPQRAEGRANEPLCLWSQWQLRWHCGIHVRRVIHAVKNPQELVCKNRQSSGNGCHTIHIWAWSLCPGRGPPGGRCPCHLRMQVHRIKSCLGSLTIQLKHQLEPWGHITQTPSNTYILTCVFPLSVHIADFCYWSPIQTSWVGCFASWLTIGIDGKASQETALISFSFFDDQISLADAVCKRWWEPCKESWYTLSMHKAE